MLDLEFIAAIIQANTVFFDKKFKLTSECHESSQPCTYKYRFGIRKAIREEIKARHECKSDPQTEQTSEDKEINEESIADREVITITQEHVGKAKRHLTKRLEQNLQNLKVLVDAHMPSDDYVQHVIFRALKWQKENINLVFRSGKQFLKKWSKPQNHIFHWMTISQKKRLSTWRKKFRPIVVTESCKAT